MKRRTFLKSSAASAGLLSLAGCGGSDLVLSEAAQAAMWCLQWRRRRLLGRRAQHRRLPHQHRRRPSRPPPTRRRYRKFRRHRRSRCRRRFRCPPGFDLPLWQWHEIPGTALASVEPAVRPLGATGPRSKIDAWCGASLKREGSVYMLGAAGGHGDYAGNEVNALVLNTASPKWVQLRAPTVNADIINKTQFYLDSRPSATHTYYATQFINSLNRMIVFASPGVDGSFPAAPSDFPYLGSRRSFSFNADRSDWDGPDFVAQYPGTAASPPASA